MNASKNCETCAGLDGIHTQASTQAAGFNVCNDCLVLQTKYRARGKPGPLDQLRAAQALNITGRLPDLGVPKTPEVV